MVLTCRISDPHVLFDCKYHPCLVKFMIVAALNRFIALVNIQTCASTNTKANVCTGSLSLCSSRVFFCSVAMPSDEFFRSDESLAETEAPRVMGLRGCISGDGAVGCFEGSPTKCLNSWTVECVV